MNVKLLKEITYAMREEPLRVEMSDWAYEHDTTAPCHTTGCIAGFALILDRMKTEKLNWVKAGKAVANYTRRADNNNIQARAARLLGIDDNEAARLFHSCSWPTPFREKFEALENEDIEFMTHSQLVKRRRRMTSLTIKRIKFFIQTQGLDEGI